MQTVDFTGTVSHATLRSEDLIPAFMQVLEKYDRNTFYRLCKEYDIDHDTYEKLSQAYVGGPLRRDKSFYESEDCDCLMEELFDALGEIAPEGYYFGSHPSDSSDYGFWPIEE